MNGFPVTAIIYPGQPLVMPPAGSHPTPNTPPPPPGKAPSIPPPPPNSKPAPTPKPADVDVIDALDKAKPATVVNDGTVRKLIAQLILRAYGKSLHDKVLAAWSQAVYKRQQGYGKDMNLMAAEHYLYARQEAHGGLLATAGVNALTVGYETLKAVSGPFRGWLSTDGSSPTPASAAGLAWGLKGAQDGYDEADYAHK